MGLTKAERETREAELEAAKAATAGATVPEGASLGDPRPAEVGDYPTRPYSEALTDDHRAVLKDADQLPED